MIATTFENIAEIETPKEEKKQSWLQSAFNAVSNTVRSFDNWLEYQFTSDGVRALDEAQKKDEIDYILLSIFYDNEINNGIELQTKVQEQIEGLEKNKSLYYGITTNDILARFAVVSDEHKKILKDAHNEQNWKNSFTLMEDEKQNQYISKYLNSDEFKTDRKNKIDHLINYRLDDDLHTKTDIEKLEIFKSEIEYTGIDEEFKITPQDMLMRYKETNTTETIKNHNISTL